MAEVERELNQAQALVEATQATFDQIVARMSTDFARFQVTPLRAALPSDFHDPGPRIRLGNQPWISVPCLTPIQG